MNQADFITLFLSFIEGFALILSPCILPILPLVLASSLDGSKRKPLGVITGFCLSFSLFAFFSRIISVYFNLNLNHVRYLAFALLLILGLILISDFLSNLFSKMTTVIANIFSNKVAKKKQQSGYLSGFIIGSLIALVWTPCAGPILATVLVQILLQDSNFKSFLMLLVFAIGAAIPMLIIAIGGHKIKESFQFFKAHAFLFRKVLGLIIILATLFIIYQENSQPTVRIEGKNSSLKITKTLEKALWQPYGAPKIEGIQNWFNSKPLTLSELKGKVILVDFWTYSCINCIRTLPYLKDWYHRYRDQGLVIIGIHSPEFEFEKDKENLKSALARFAIDYPVAMDNQLITWRNFNNHYWPAHYLINQQGNVVYTHFGEGEYDITENNIRYLLGLNGVNKSVSTNQNYAFGQTGETYLGYERSSSDLRPNPYPASVATQFNYPAVLNLNSWALEGKWQILADKIVSAEPKAAIKIHFQAAKVYAVMDKTTKEPIQVKVLVNGQEIKNIEVKKAGLFSLYETKNAKKATLELIAKPKGLEIFTFTFGN